MTWSPPWPPSRDPMVGFERMLHRWRAMRERPRRRRARAGVLLALRPRAWRPGRLQMRNRGSLALAAVAIGIAGLAQALAQGKPALDFNFYRAKVEPIFLTKKDGHTRCMVCHIDANNHFRLEKMSPGAKAWSEEQSRK